MDLIIELHNILHPHFYLVDNPDSDTPITNFEKLLGYNKLFWKLNGKNKRLISVNKQNELIEIVKQLNIGKTQLYKFSGIGKYLVLELLQSI